jgi:hypothetical protein
MRTDRTKRTLVTLLLVGTALFAGCSVPSFDNQQDRIELINLYSNVDEPRGVEIRIANESGQIYSGTFQVEAAGGMTEPTIRTVMFDTMVGRWLEVTAVVDGESVSKRFDEDTSYGVLVRVGRGLLIQKGLENATRTATPNGSSTAVAAGDSGVSLALSPCRSAMPPVA